jgi:hypothetical protein
MANYHSDQDGLVSRPDPFAGNAKAQGPLLLIPIAFIFRGGAFRSLRIEADIEPDRLSSRPTTAPSRFKMDKGKAPAAICTVAILAQRAAI